MAAFLSDALAVSIILVLPASIISYGMALIGGSMRIQIVWFAALGILSAYILFRDGYQGRSLGKQALGLRLLTRSGRPCGWIRSFIRNLPLFVPLLNLVEIGFVLYGRPRTGDRIAGTTVAEE